MKSSWEQTASIKKMIYDMAQKKENAPSSSELPPQYFNPMSD